MNSKKKVIIVGGGISGLACAHRLYELNREGAGEFDVTILEASSRFGGLIETSQENGFFFEMGPDAFISEKPWALDLCKRIGLENELQEIQEQFRYSYILHKGQLRQIPKGFYLISSPNLKTLLDLDFVSLSGKVRMAFERFLPPSRAKGDESVAQFMRRRFGQEALDRIAQPMIGGIYTADPEYLSLQATFPKLMEMERQFGSVTKGLLDRESKTTEASGPRYQLFLSLRGGMQTLVSSLVDELKGFDLRTNAKVASIQRNEKWNVELSDGSSLTADLLCLAVPAYQQAKLLRGFSASLAGLLDSVPYESVITVNMAFPEKALKEVIPGVGFVVPAIENKSLIGCTIVHQKFANRVPEGYGLIRAFVGGAFDREALGREDSVLVENLLGDFKDLFNITEKPLVTKVQRYQRSMPQFVIGHRARVKRILESRTEWPDLFLTGNFFDGVGIPDCIHHAEKTAEQMV